MDEAPGNSIGEDGNQLGSAAEERHDESGTTVEDGERECKVRSAENVKVLEDEQVVSEVIRVKIVLREELWSSRCCLLLPESCTMRLRKSCV